MIKFYLDNLQSENTTAELVTFYELILLL